MATIFHIDGFEHGVWSSAGGGLITTIAGSGGTATIEAEAARSGGYGLKVVTAGNSRYALQAVPPSETVSVSVGYIRFPSLPSAEQVLLEAAFTYGANQAYARYGLNASNELFTDFYDSGPQTRQTRTGAISANIWYRLEFRVNVTGTTWTIDWRAAESDGVATEQTQNVYVKGTAGTQFNGWRYGLMAGGTTTLHMDDVVASYTSDDYPLGPVKVLGYKLEGVGTHNLDASPSEHFFKNDGSDTALTSGETTSYQTIDDVPVDGGADYVFVQPRSGPTEPTNTWYTEYTIENSVEGSDPLAVRGIVALLNSAAGVSNMIAKIRDGASESNIFSGDPASTTRVYKSAVFATKPSGGGWTDAAFNALMFRFGYTADATPNPRLHTAIVESVFSVTPSAAASIMHAHRRGR